MDTQLYEIKYKISPIIVYNSIIEQLQINAFSCYDDDGYEFTVSGRDLFYYKNKTRIPTINYFQQDFIDEAFKCIGCLFNVQEIKSPKYNDFIPDYYQRLIKHHLKSNDEWKTILENEFDMGKLDGKIKEENNGIKWKTTTGVYELSTITSMNITKIIPNESNFKIGEMWNMEWKQNFSPTNKYTKISICFGDGIYCQLIIEQLITEPFCYDNQIVLWKQKKVCLNDGEKREFIIGLLF